MLERLDETVVAQIQDMVAAVHGNREPEVNGAEGLKALLVIEAIYRSGRSGQPVHFPGSQA